MSKEEKNDRRKLLQGCTNSHVGLDWRTIEGYDWLGIQEKNINTEMANITVA
jgi:hypothetical protein